MFLSERYPSEAPKFFVRPTANMTIKANHRHVDMQGVVYLPYLHEWRFESHLVGLVEIASAIFSIEPPLYAKPATSTVSAVSSTPSAATSTGGYAFAKPVAAAASSTPAVISAVPSSSNTSSVARGTILYPGASNVSAVAYPGSSSTNAASTSYSAVPSPAIPASSGTYSTSALNPVVDKEKRQALLEKANLKLHSKLYDLHQSLNKELNKEFENDRYLEQSDVKAKQHIQQMKAYIQDMQDSILEIEDKKSALEKYEKEQEAKPKAAAEEYLQAYDDLSTQITKLHAELNAIDDAFYFLERALVQSQNKSVDLNAFLRESRVLARQQFMCKAHLGKISAHCMQVQHQFQQQQQQQQQAMPIR